VSVDPEAMPFTPGDSLGVWFRNDPALVDELITITGADAEAGVSTNGEEKNLREALLNHCELTRLHPAFVRGYAELANISELLTTVSAETRLKDYVSGRQVIDVVREFPASVEPSALIAALRPLEPRLYSIASSPLEYDDEIHLTVSVVKYRAFGRSHTGGASGYLAHRIGEDDDLGVYVVENPNFRLPSEANRSIIMIGAGTGVAPYRAFMQHREARGDNGKNWLMFGNRHFHSDFLYQLEWQRYRHKGLLTRVDPVFSRDQEDKVYIQHRLRERGRELFHWLEEGAHVYVCGDTRMARDVHQTLLEVVARQARLTPDQASEYVDELRRQARYQRDVY
jgi:sulfite reductase (NADPH) flavoprotein alpha-component